MRPTNRPMAMRAGGVDASGFGHASWHAVPTGSLAPSQPAIARYRDPIAMNYCDYDLPDDSPTSPSGVLRSRTTPPA